MTLVLPPNQGPIPEPNPNIVQDLPSTIPTLSSDNSMMIFGIGSVPVQPVGTQTSPEVQQEWDNEMSTISKVVNEIVDDLNANPPQPINPNDLNDLLNALISLDQLAQLGITDSDGNTYYLTKDMAQALNAMLVSFASIGITPNMDTSNMTSSSEVALLTKIGSSSNVQTAVKEAAGCTNQDLGFQTYIYTMGMQMINAQSAGFGDLEDGLNESNDILNDLSDLVKASSYTAPPTPWPTDLDLNDPGDIPPSSVPEIQQYIEDNGGNSQECQFEDIYDQEYAAAEQRSAQNGTSVQDEMRMAGSFPPYHPTSSEILTGFLGNKGDSDRIADVDQMLLDGSVGELSNVPTPPPGETMSDVGLDIWNTTQELQTEINNLTAEGADPDMIDSLQQVVDDVNAAWSQALASANPPLPANSTPQDAIDAGRTDVVDNFAVNYINSTQPGQPASSDLNTCVQRFQSWNEDLQRQFQQAMTQLESLVKMMGQLLKMANDISEAYIRNFS